MGGDRRRAASMLENYLLPTPMRPTLSPSHEEYYLETQLEYLKSYPQPEEMEQLCAKVLEARTNTWNAFMFLEEARAAHLEELDTQFSLWWHDYDQQRKEETEQRVYCQQQKQQETNQLVRNCKQLSGKIWGTPAKWGNAGTKGVFNKYQV